MTDAEIKAVADELEARAVAAAKDKWAKVRSFVTHNTVGVVVGAVVVYVVLRFLL